MLAPLSWLRDFTPLEGSTSDLVDALNGLGLVVEGVNVVGEGLESIVAVKVLGIDAIDGADKIRLVHVDTGDGEPLDIVCGAMNFEVGDVVPLAPVGAKLPDGFEIGRRKMRGIWSNGMLCSARELGLGDDHGGLMLLPTSLVAGTPFVQAMGIEPDVVFDLAIETNRPDAMCMAGVARDLAAFLKLPFEIPTPPTPVKAESDVKISIDLQSPQLCDRFVATAFEGVQVGAGDPTVARRLALAGMRSISNVVDASNYVMLELGQPTHAYDLDALDGTGFIVRAAREGETLVTLDGVLRSFAGVEPDCLICDANDVPIGIGGVMGGQSTEVRETTSRIVLEAAHFDQLSIARTSRRHALRSEASARFERGCDPDNLERATNRFVQLLGGVRQIGPVNDTNLRTHGRRQVPVRVARVNALLGTSLDAAQISGYLAPLGFAAVASEVADELQVELPSYRPDATQEVDVIEEVARHYGYRNIQRTTKRSPYVGTLSAYQSDRRKLRALLSGSGFHEILTDSLVAPGAHQKCGFSDESLLLELDNPLASEQSILRVSLLPSMLGAVVYNAQRRNLNLSLFEVGHVYSMPATETALPHGRSVPLPDEHERFGALVYSPQCEGAPLAAALWARIAAEFRLLDPELRATEHLPGTHPTRTTVAYVDDVAIGAVGEIDPQVLSSHGLEGRMAWVELRLQRLFEAARKPDSADTPSKFPSSDIDLALVAPSTVTAASIRQALQMAAGDLLEQLSLIDIYRDGERLGEGHRSLAFRLRFCAPDRTLTDVEVGELRQRCIDSAHAVGASIRS